MEQKIKLNLGRIQETLLLPLVSRAKETQYKNPLLNDSKAVELFNQLDVNRKKLLSNITEIGVQGLAYRAFKMDEAIKAFLQKHPNGKILDIGAGLDTTYYRCDNGKALWFDLDMPDSIALRTQLLPPPNSRVTYIAKSMFDYTWIDDIGDISNGLFITIPGVLPYFKEEEVQKLLTTIAPRLKGAEIMFDVISQMGRFFVDMRIKAAGMKEAHLEWGILDPKTVTNWSEHIELVRTIKFFEKMPKSNRRISTSLAMQFNKLFDMTQLFHLRFV
ncbi:MAG TPA: class I SAM-dependent methyltransferase [Chitinophagales bacterium]|jgi:O-methyltransferase involved in polyketide biosynthesis|nr:class I SAM-dependent methyltransferase [Chitinophagales bacterium]MBP6153813.1 class I SAM-dependent methyltransferase [Chitinophagales bacterium]HQV77712.1 class I SAM-dependent methyltransferase [Chitinophagales bacterium]HQW78185.1 class I SAM-dependent methyltransferase [Chitinophagales bacterium]HRB18575.1 class I SAM-dependent methyltransferase [Chitinophagales bacterium]